MGWLTHLFPSIPNYILQVSQASPPNANGQNPTPNPAHERIDDFRILPYGRFQEEVGFLGGTGSIGLRGGLGMMWSEGYGHNFYGLEFTGYYGLATEYNLDYFLSLSRSPQPASMFGLSLRLIGGRNVSFTYLPSISFNYFNVESTSERERGSIISRTFTLGLHLGTLWYVVLSEFTLNLGYNFASDSVVLGLNFSVGGLLSGTIMASRNSRNVLRHQAETEITQTQIQFRLQNVAVRSSALDSLAENLRTHPHIRRIRIIGYAADAASISQNLHLSEQRANAVRDYLIDQGISPTRLEAVGRGRPADAPEGRSTRPQDRRVEFEVVEVD